MRSPVLVISVLWADRRHQQCQREKRESQRANRNVVVPRNENSTKTIELRWMDQIRATFSTQTQRHAPAHPFSLSPDFSRWRIHHLSFIFISITFCYLLNFAIMIILLRTKQNIEFHFVEHFSLLKITNFRFDFWMKHLNLNLDLKKISSF